MKMMQMIVGAAVLLCCSAAADAQGVGLSDPAGSAARGWTMEQDREPGWAMDQYRKLQTAVDALKPQRPGVIDAYVVAIGLDADGVFTKEASEAANVLARRYDAAGRTLTLVTGANGAAPQGSPPMLASALSAIAAKMDLKEDVLILFTTSHGDPNVGLVYKDSDKGLGLIAPPHMSRMLDGIGFQRRMVIISACFSGVFVPALANDNSIVLTAASATRSSFGCAASNDWTFFGDALLNHAMRKPQPLDAAVKEAHGMIEGWESGRRFPASGPQASYGKATDVWLKALEARTPKDAGTPIGKPANDFDK